MKIIFISAVLHVLKYVKSATPLLEAKILTSGFRGEEFRKNSLSPYRAKSPPPPFFD